MGLGPGPGRGSGAARAGRRRVGPRAVEALLRSTGCAAPTDRGRRLRRLLRQRASRRERRRDLAARRAAAAPNWKHLPIGYHGRAGTVVVSGSAGGPTQRPAQGARRAAAPDLRAEPAAGHRGRAGFRDRRRPAPGTSVGVGDFAEHVFGVVVLNDWSARDMQAWEYVPLGPFLGKSFATSISAWVVPLQALEPAGSPLPPRTRRPGLPATTTYTATTSTSRSRSTETWSAPPVRRHVLSPAQQLAHLTVNGASLRTGDLFASGTISGPATDQCGSLLELTWNGAQPLLLGDEERRFLPDGDKVVLRASAGRGGRSSRWVRWSAGSNRRPRAGWH